MKPSAPTDLGRELVRFFEEFLPGQRGLSPNTVRSYRDVMLLLLQFTAADAKRPVDRLQVSDLTAERVAALSVRMGEHLGFSASPARRPSSTA